MSKSHNLLAIAALAALTTLTALPATAQTEPSTSSLPAAPKLGETDASRSYWGWGLGLVFTEVPISESDFTVFMSELHYGYYLTDPNEFMRTAMTLGVYGFALVLPVPKVGVEMIIGEPTQDVQGKVGVAGFYDISVGGHGGLAVELGARIKNKVDVSFFTVPTGWDSKRDYLEFVGVRDVEGPKPYVILPYFGLFVGFNY